MIQPEVSRDWGWDAPIFPTHGKVNEGEVMYKRTAMRFMSLMLVLHLVLAPICVVQAAQADLTFELVSHSWDWHPNVPNGRDHGSRGKVYFRKVTTTGNIRTESVPIVKEPSFTGFPRVERVLASDGVTTLEVRNINDGLINLTGDGILFTGDEQATSQKNEAVFESDNCCLIPGWDINFGITNSRGRDQCVDGDHTKDNAVELGARYPGNAEPIVFARLKNLSDSQVIVDYLNPAVELYWMHRFANGGQLVQGQVINLFPLLSKTSGNPFPSYFWSGLFTVAMKQTPEGMALMKPAVFVIKAIKGQHAGITGIVPDSIVAMAGNHSGEELVFQYGFFGLKWGRFFTGGLCP